MKEYTIICWVYDKNYDFKIIIDTLEAQNIYLAYEKFFKTHFLKVTDIYKILITE